MPLFLREKGLCFVNALGMTSCGITFLPSLIEFSRKASKVFKGRRNYYPRFVLATNESGRELSIESRSLIDRLGGGKDSLSFSEIIMNWGYHRLGTSDALILCEKNKYYVARHVWDNWYRLDNWKRFLFTNDICNGNGARKNVKEINLAFKKKTDNGEPSKLKIWLKSCSFKKNGSSSGEDKQWSWNMECKGNKQENGKLGENQECVTLSINQSNYKLEYKRERKNTGK